MITIRELKHKALTYWERQTILRAWLNDEPLFPLALPCGAPSSRVLSERFAEVRDWVSQLKAQSATGYRIDFKTIQHRQLGQQQIPHRIVFEQRENLLRFIGKTRDFADFVALAETTLHRWPRLKDWLARKPLTALNHAADWSRLLAVCNYFAHHPRPRLYLRQLSIPQVDSKFIEQHKAVLSELLEAILPDSAFDQTITGLAQHGFERRFGLRYDQALIRFRLLDPDQTIAGLSDLSLPLADFHRLSPLTQHLFITENKINGLSFPPLSNAMVVFGLGYGIQALAEVPWLTSKDIIYWGDIDTHGFAILSQLRGYFPQVRSLLMDRDTLLRFKTLCVQEPEGKRFSGELQHLTASENSLFRELQENHWGGNLRLEQERIAFDYVLESLRVIAPMTTPKPS